MDLTWMAWTPYTAIFFIFVISSLIVMIIWEKFKPGGSPRRGILGLVTTRGDRLFLSYLGSGYVFLVYLFFIGPVSLWWSLVLCLLFAIFVFKWV